MESAVFHREVLVVVFSRATLDEPLTVEVPCALGVVLLSLIQCVNGDVHWTLINLFGSPIMRKVMSL